MELEFRFANAAQSSPPLPGRVLIRVARNTNQFTMQISRGDGPLLPPHQSAHLENQTLVVMEPQADGIQLKPFLDMCGKLSQTLYVGPFRNAINVGSNENYFDIQVGQGFVQRWRQYKTGTAKTQNLAAYRVSEEIGHIFGFKRIDINAADDGQSMRVYIDGSPYELHEVGSGLTQFILVLVNAAIRRPAFILIDEPELNLHPSLQLDFLTTLASYADEGVYFATHSYGLARASAERVYALSRIAQGESDVRPLESVNRLSEFLGELSFAGYRDMGFEKILLVEGPTEVKTIQQFLRLLGKDHKVVLLPLGGSSMINDRRGTELEEVKRISENVSALIDSERAAEGANGMLFTLVKHIKPNVPQTTVSLLATTPKPRLVKLVILPLGEESLSSGSTEHKAMHYVVKVKIGGVAGLLAPILGKQPPDMQVWVLSGEAPAFVKLEGPLYNGGPIWRVQLAAPATIP